MGLMVRLGLNEIGGKERFCSDNKVGFEERLGGARQAPPPLYTLICHAF